jgi:tetratricopeptide (TPR) repeat protein
LKVDIGGEVVIIEKTQSYRRVLEHGIGIISLGRPKVLPFPDIASALKGLQKHINGEINIALITTDLFLTDDLNIFTLIKKMESEQKLWNIPILLNSNLADRDMFNRVRKDIVHIPFRMRPKTIDEGSIAKTCLNLLEFKDENLNYLKLEREIDKFVLEADISRVGEIIEKIDEYSVRFPNALHKAKREFIKGRTCYDLWKNISKLENTAETAELRQKAYIYLKNAHDTYPNHWKILLALHTYHMDEGNMNAAKLYLEELVKLFPEHSEYHYRLGKMNEKEGNTVAAVRDYNIAGENVMNEGIDNFPAEYVVNIVDSSLNSTKDLLADMGMSKIGLEGLDKKSAEYQHMQMLQKSNADVRNTLFRLSKKKKGDSELFNKIAITYRRIGNYSLALENYVKAVNIESENHRIRINYAAALAMYGKWEKASEEMIVARRLDREGEDSDAIEAVTKAVEERDGARLQKLLI